MNIAIHSLIVSIDSFNFNTILNRYYNSLPNINEVIEYNESVDCLSEKHCYRLSLRNTSTSYIHEIPNADNHSHVDKIGYLQKQYGMTFPYLSQWRRRYCVLKKGLMYLYEKDTSKGNERTNLVIDLKYFDLVTEALQKDAKKGLNVFLVASDSDRRFFDPGRHRFAAESPSEMQDWITKIRHSIELSRNNNKLINEKKPKEPIKEINRKSDKGGPKDETNESSQKEMSDKAREKQMSGKLDLDNKEIKPVENVDSKFQKSNEALFQESTQPSSDVNEVSPETEDKPPSPDVDTRPRKQSSKKIVLQPPSIDLHTKPCLESITKHRIKGPSGRRAPQTRPSVLMKQRASSMSALLQEELPKDDTRVQMPNFDQGCVECGCTSEHSPRRVSLNSSHPILAYDYSSDEDSPLGGDISPIGMDEFNTIPMCATPPPLPPKRGLICSLQTGSQIHSRSPDVPTHKKNDPSTSSRIKCPPSYLQDNDVEDILEYRSLPKSLIRSPRKRKSREKHIINLIRANPEINAYPGVVCLGTVSPEMDALDNLLMNRSIQTGGPELDEILKPTDQDGSEASTYKAGGENVHAIDDRLTKAVDNLSSVLEHLQHHTAELECRTKQIDTEMRVSRKDVAVLQDTTEGMRMEMQRLAETLTNLTQETSKAQNEYISHCQEMENLKEQSSWLISDTKRAKVQLQSTRKEYEASIRDLRELISSVKSSFVVKKQEKEEDRSKSMVYVEEDTRKRPISVEETKKKITLGEAGKSYSESDTGGVISPKNQILATQSTTTSSTPKSTSSQKGYQSFFQRPSNFISNITTSWGQGKSTSNKKERDNKEQMVTEIEIKENGCKEKEIEKLDKMENKMISKMDNNTSARNDEDQRNKEEISKTRKRRDDNLKKSENETGSKRGLTGFSNENLPMMDDTDDHEMDRVTPDSGIRGLSSQIEKICHHNYQIEKSVSSPSVPSKLSTSNRSNFIPASHSSDEETYSYTQASPDIFYKPNGRCNYAYEPCMPLNRYQRPLSSSSIDENSSVMSYPDEPPPRPRPRVYAITKQKSSPNIPLQRQSSGTMFPLQRQHSLGIVPEEGQLPRHDSLMSVPEERAIVDRTLPLSPSASMVSFALSPSPSGDRLNAFRERSSLRTSMELLTGPVVAGSLLQESLIREMPRFSGFETAEGPIATSSLKRKNKKNGRSDKLT